MIKIYCIPDTATNVTLDITHLVKTVTNIGDSSLLARKLTLTLAFPLWDVNQPRISVPNGTKIWMVLDSEEIFRGVVFTTEVNTSEELIITAYDYLIYLNKSKVTYNFAKVTPEAACKTVCKDLGITVGSVFATGKKVSLLVSSQSACEAIMGMYDLIKSGGYLLTITGTNVNVIKKGVLETNFTMTIKQSGTGNNTISNDMTATLDNMVNRVKIYDSTGVYKAQVEDKTSQGKYGTIQSNYTIEDGVNQTTAAKALLAGITQTVTVECLGNWLCLTGCLMNTDVFYLGSMTNVKYLIDGDTHTWNVETSEYSMSLNLVTN